ncbi:hypothetical protein L195_g012048 [Trifolium pratense]|uniref:Uncharacterized protein n=1 Tax=Trifolium pratense TaxID=57577 RepID=A0A2K3PJB8_TRIPR|nr:hypothetical protein L195_g012048 [Trifolium pratense]
MQTIKFDYRYTALTKRTISVSGSNFSSLEWTSIAWATGLTIAIPILSFISFHLNSQFQTLITAVSTSIGVFFCLPAGFFKTTKIFIPYIAFIVLATTVASSSHTHHLALMVSSFKKSKTQKVSSFYSLLATSFGCLGSAIISAFIYHMLREADDRNLYTLWIVSIFSGLIWGVGILHVVTAINRTSVSSVSLMNRTMFYPCHIFKHPKAIAALFGVFLSSFTTMCIFTGAVLFIVGNLCIRPLHLLYFWLTYFLIPLISLPLLHPLQQLLNANSAKMKIIGLLLSMLSSGFGFYFWNSHWKWGHILIFGGIQSIGSGVLHAFGRVLVLEYAPTGKEGVFCVWYGWIRAAGLCLGFTVASVVPGQIKTSFGVAFVAALVGIVVLLFGNVDHNNSESGSNGNDNLGLDSKESVSV